MRSVKGAKLLGSLVIFAFAAAVAMWFFTVAGERERYLTARNFRLLATIASQLDTSIETQERTFQTLLTPAETSKQQDPLHWFVDSAAYVPSLQAIDRDRRPTRFRMPKREKTKFTRSTRIAIEERKSWFHVSISRNDEAAGREAYLDMGAVLAPLFGPKLRDGAFDTLILASVDGRVIYAEGARSAELAHGRLDTLSAPPPFMQLFGQMGAPAAPRNFASVARTNGTIDVIVSGTRYKLFSQPCPPSTRLETGEAGVLVVGLIDAAVFSSKARQFPTTLVFVFSALILLAFTGWPFLRMRLIGERQRIRRIEVVQVIASAVFGVALLTVCCFDWFAYWHLNRVRDVNLETLAGEIQEHANSELRDAGQQLRTLTTLALKCATTLDDSVQLAEVNGLRGIFDEEASKTLRARCGVPAGTKGWPAQWDGAAIAAQPYPRFKTMSLVDKTGYQHIKWTSRQWQPAPIDVSVRSYFKNARGGRLWRLDASDSAPSEQPCDSRPPDSSYTLESIWSWTTAEPEAVMAIATCSDDYPVATVTIPMRSLIGPVVPTDVEFAIIAEDGAVLFHSDPQRNTHENLFEESDHNRRLRAAVTARIAEHVNLQYAGRSYRSYVGRFGSGTPWTIVTLSNNEPMWGLHTEWLILSLVALGIFMSFLAALFAFCFFTGRAEWLWADSDKIGRYDVLSVVTATLLLISLAVLAVGGNRTVMVLSVALPLMAWAVAYVTVSRAARRSESARDPHTEWGSLAVLLFLLTGIIPAAGFLLAAYRVDVRADVRYVQLRFAQALAQHDDRVAEIASEYPGVPSVTMADSIARDYGVYHSPWPSQSPVNLRPGGLPSVRFVTGVVKPTGDSARDAFDEIAELVAEEYLPYYSERSVQIRELLLHHRAQDSAWWWNGERLTFTRQAGAPAIQIAAAVPRLADGLLDAASVVPGVLVVLGAMGLVALAWCGVWFIETYVCLRGVAEPLWPSTTWTGTSGRNLFVTCEADVRDELAQGCIDLRREHQRWSVPDDALMQRLLERDQQTPGWPILFSDFDDHLADPARAARQFAWIEQLAADGTHTVVVASANAVALVDQMLGGGEQVERWHTVLKSFVALDWRTNAPERYPSSKPWLSVLRNRPPSQIVGAMRAQIGARQYEVARNALTSEAMADAVVRAMCAGIEKRLSEGPPVRGRATAAVATIEPDQAPATVHTVTLRLSPEQVLDEIADRTDAWYGHIWRSCTPDEKLVLAEIALEGFVNYKSRRVVRRLLGRRLVTKKPSFRLMNETFRRFVLSPGCQADVQAIEGTSEPSPWDRARVPFFTVLVAGSLFFLVTQRELFNATIATLSTLVAAVPVIIRVAALVVGKQVPSEVKS